MIICGCARGSESRPTLYRITQRSGAYAAGSGINIVGRCSPFQFEAACAMYSTCLFCHSDLGLNETIESFPVGRRLAFDPSKGRLWVVCRRCERWNLSPLEERWEAVEEAERLFRGTRLRVSTENIGLAKLREGIELVRVGKPLRPEMAAWRYGDQFGRRRRKKLALAAAIPGSAALIVYAGAAAGIGAGVMAYLALYAYAAGMKDANSPAQPIARVRISPASDIAVFKQDLRYIRLLQGGGDSPWRLQLADGPSLSGRAAMDAAAKILPLMNPRGGSQRQVSSAISVLERGDRPSDSFTEVARWNPRLASCPRPVLLALEMAAHEETERRALDGELRELEVAWKEAEQIAAIADRLLVPAIVEDAFRRLRSGRA